MKTEVEIPEIELTFGGKYQGNQKIVDLIETLHIDRVEVLSVKGLSHEQAFSFLTQMAPAIFVEWEDLNQKYQKNPENFLQDFETLYTLKTIRKAIKFCFDQAKNDDPSKPFAKQLDEWLAKIRRDNSYVMLRSSSLEDLQELANAGGNKNIAYVESERSEILFPCGKVAASYFSVRSLKNCLESGINRFSKAPTLSVLLQKLIGKTVGGESGREDIPVSLVMFTSEPS